MNPLHAELSVGVEFVTLSARCQPTRPGCRPDAAREARRPRGVHRTGREIQAAGNELRLPLAARRNRGRGCGAKGFFASLQIARPLRTHGEIFHLVFHHRPEPLPERNPPPLAPPRRIARGNPTPNTTTSRHGNTRTKRFFCRTEKILHGELAKKIEEALAELPENQRTAILLCRQDELSYEEIAKVLACSLSATKSIIHRGRETLKEKLKPYLQTGDWDA